MANLVGQQRLTVVPVKLAAQEKLPHLALVAYLPMVREIRLRVRLAGDETREARMQRMGNVLLGTTG